MTQRRKSQNIGLLVVVIFSAVLLGALAAVSWPVPVVYADGPPGILTITVTSSLETYFHDPGLDPTGGTVYFNSVEGEGAGQVLTVTVTCSGTVTTFEGAPAFNETPPPDISAPWQVTYTVEADVGTQSGIVFTVTNALSETDTALITFTIDTADPEITSPGIEDYGSDYLHVDDLTVYYGDDMLLPQTFRVHGSADDNAGVGLHYAAFSSALGGAPNNDNSPSQWAGDYTANADDTDSGLITATVYDLLGNSATQVFTYTRDIISPTIVPTAISETSPYLYAEGLTLYYSDRMGGSAQDFEVQGTASDNIGGAGFMHATFPLAFGESPDPDSNSPWSGVYDVVSANNGNGNIVVTAYDNVSNWSTGVFTYIEDTINPTLTLTYVTPGGYDVDDPDDYLDADGNWYKASNFTGGDWEFHYTIADDGGAGLDYGSALWDHSNDMDDRQIPELDLDGDDVFNDVDDDGDGTVTVTLTISDTVGNPDSATVVFNIDNTGPVITSPHINDFDSPYLHVVNSTTVYYGDDMIGLESFTVNGHSSDGDGVGLKDTVEFSLALGDTPSNMGTPEDWWGEYNAANYNTGSGTIIVTVYDLLDNPATQVFTYTRDTANPTSVASSPQYDNGNPIVVTYSNATDTGGSGLQWVELWYKKEVTGTWADSGLSPQTGPSGSFNFPPTGGDGTYYFASVATDNVGNQETAPTGSGDDETLYDTMQPSVPGNFAYLPDSDSGGDGFPPQAADYYDDRTIDLEWDPSTDNGSGLLTYHLGTAPQPTGGTYPEDSSYNVGGSGTYSLYLTAEDNAGNISDDAVTGPVVVDTQAPQGSMTCPEGTDQKWFTVSWLATDQGPAGLRSGDPYSVWYNVDHGGWQDWIIGTSAVIATFGPDSPVTVGYEHTYCFRMRAVDKAGNVWTSDGNDCTEVSPAYPTTKTVLLPLIMTADPNWGFELGDFTNWQHGGQLAQSVSTAMPYSGNYSALLGNPGYPCQDGLPEGDSSAWMSRSVKVPSSGSPSLRFQYRIYTQDYNIPTEPWQYDYFAVNINGTEVFTDSNTIYPADWQNCTKTSGTTYDLDWQQGNVPLNAYTTGETIKITFYNYNLTDTHYNTYTYVDDISVQ